MLWSWILLVLLLATYIRGTKTRGDMGCCYYGCEPCDYSLCGGCYVKLATGTMEVRDESYPQWWILHSITFALLLYRGLEIYFSDFLYFNIHIYIYMFDMHMYIYIYTYTYTYIHIFLYMHINISIGFLYRVGFLYRIEFLYRIGFRIWLCCATRLSSAIDIFASADHPRYEITCRGCGDIYRDARHQRD